MARAAWWMVCASLCFGLGCDGTETGNPSLTDSELGLIVRSSDDRVAVVRDAGRVRIDEVWVFTTGARLRSCDATPVVTSFELPLRDLSARPLLTTPIMPGRYCGLQLDVAPAPDPAPVSAPAELAGASVLLRGARGDGTAFTLRSVVSSTVTIDSNAFSAAEGAQLLLAFDAAVWFSGIDLDSASVGANGLRIDALENHALLTTFEAALVRGVRLHDDQNRDGLVNSGEEGGIAHGP